MEGLVLAGIVLSAAFLIGLVVVIAFRSADRHHPIRRGRHGGRGGSTASAQHPMTTEARVPGPPPPKVRVNRPPDLAKVFQPPPTRRPGIWPGTPEDEQAQRLAVLLKEVWLAGTPIVPTTKGSTIDWNAYARAVVARSGAQGSPLGE